MAKIGRPRKKGRPKGIKKQDDKGVIVALQDNISALKDCIKAKDQALEIFNKFEGMIFAIHDKVRALEEKLTKLNGER